MLTTLLTVLHLIVCILLIFIVLIQSSKGAELGAAFGGSNQTIFGSRGATTFLNKFTTIAAVVFMLTSLSLAVIHGGSSMTVTKPVKEFPAESTTEPIQQELPVFGEEVPVQDQPAQPAE